MGARPSRVISGGVCRFEPAWPLVMHTETTSLPARAHLARVPPTVNSWSSGWAWIERTRAGAAGSAPGSRSGVARSGTPVDVWPSDSVMVMRYPLVAGMTRVTARAVVASDRTTGPGAGRRAARLAPAAVERIDLGIEGRWAAARDRVVVRSRHDDDPLDRRARFRSPPRLRPVRVGGTDCPRAHGVREDPRQVADVRPRLARAR